MQDEAQQLQGKGVSFKNRSNDGDFQGVETTSNITKFVPPFSRGCGISRSKVGRPTNFLKYSPILAPFGTTDLCHIFGNPGNHRDRSACTSVRCFGKPGTQTQKSCCGFSYRSMIISFKILELAFIEYIPF